MDQKAALILIGGTLLIFAAYRLTAATGDGAGAVDDGTGDEPAPDTNIFEDTMNTITNAITGNEIAAIVEAGRGYIVVIRPDGTKARLTGARNWRNNNPGNIEAGAFANSKGSLGSDGRFAVFPTYDTGRRAKESLIFENKSYSGLTLTAAIDRYAPPVENDTGWYQSTVLASVGNVDKAMKNYTSGERQSIMNAMERVEGFKPGSVQVIA